MEDLRRLRLARGLSQAGLARLAHLTPTAISHFETGKRRPCLGNLHKLARALEVTADALLGGPAIDGVPPELAETWPLLGGADRGLVVELARRLARRGVV